MTLFLVGIIFQTLAVGLLAAQHKFIVTRRGSLQSSYAELLEQPLESRADIFQSILDASGDSSQISPANTTFPNFDTLSKTERLCALKDAVGTAGSHFVSVSEPVGQRLPHYGRCAVVSSSGVLRLHSHGPAIDAADFVIRFNTAPTRNFEAHVGQRDDMRLVNEKVLDEWGEGLHVDLLTQNTTYAATCTICNVGTDRTLEPSEFLEREQTLLDAHSAIELFTSDLLLEPTLEQLFQHTFGMQESPAGVTTGAVGMAVALSMCDEVYAYGMAASASHDSSSVPYNYFEDVAGLENTQNWHESFNEEKILWRHIADNSPIDIDATDIAIIKGFSRVECPDWVRSIFQLPRSATIEVDINTGPGIDLST